MPHFIHDTCIGCGVCEIKCPTHTITGDKNEKYVIHADRCIDCSVCARYCPVSCIQDQKGELVEKVHQLALDAADAAIINPGAWTHYSYGIRDALAILKAPIVEIGMSGVWQLAWTNGMTSSRMYRLWKSSAGEMLNSRPAPMAMPTSAAGSSRCTCRAAPARQRGAHCGAARKGTRRAGRPAHRRHARGAVGLGVEQLFDPGPVEGEVDEAGSGDLDPGADPVQVQGLDDPGGGVPRRHSDLFRQCHGGVDLDVRELRGPDHGIGLAELFAERAGNCCLDSGDNHFGRIIHTVQIISSAPPQKHPRSNAGSDIAHVGARDGRDVTPRCCGRATAVPG